MNGRVSKLLRKVFTDPQELARFRKAYTRATKEQQAQVRTQAKKIKAVRQKGGEVKTFKINPETHQMEENHAA